MIKVVLRNFFSRFCIMRNRTLFLNILGYHLHPSAVIANNCVYRVHDLVVGENSFINFGCVFYGSSSNKVTIKIGKNVQLGYNVNLCCSTHDYSNSLKRAGKTSNSPISIGDGCWIGSNVTILGGINIAKGCVIASGSVVTKDCEADCLYGGVPARILKRL